MHALMESKLTNTVPKLLEISMTSGTFQVGETVGRMVDTGLE